ncbi:hypothetical protein [Streptomyces sp. NPDC058861]|uniref:hypothetical protein n=1 Tax=Streptomyces sp. NPDC058861 TaxID=3346653 RepID=UPI0036B01570
MSTEQGATDAPVILRQIGLSAEGAPLYAYADRSPVAQPAPIKPSRPVGAYVAAGIGGAVAIGFLSMAAALLAVAVAVGAVSATVCLLVLRAMWQDLQNQKEKKK